MLVLSAFLALSLAPRADASVWFRDAFVPIDAERLQQLRDVKALAPFLMGDGAIRVASFKYDDANHIDLVRFESEYCHRDACVTAIFLNGVSDAGLSTFSPLPPLLSFNDVSVQACANCPRTFALLFKFADERQTSFAVINGKVMHAPVVGP